jgi:ABC-type nitrate/sulfonate/bicarbonate transport system ATPase subunit
VNIMQTSGETTRTSDVLLSIEHVSLTLGNTLILRDITTQVTRNETAGEVICFLGPSGIGKTQLSRIIAGLQVPSSGQVVMQDGKIAGRGRACMVPQAYPMFDYTTIMGNLTIAGKQGGLSAKEIAERAGELIETFDLGDHAQKYPAQLSGGTKQRAAIVRQLMCPSNYIVMDEPFSGLDIAMKKRATQTIIKLSQIDTYRTIIVVTHDVTEGLSVADLVWLMGWERVDNAFIPGARLVEQYDLAGMNLAWRKDIVRDPQFIELAQHIKDRFDTLR